MTSAYEYTPLNSDEILKLAGLLAPVIDTKTCEAGMLVRVATNTRLVSLERYRDKPSTMHRTVEFRQASEFVDYLDRFGEVNRSAGFASIRPLRVRVLIDYGDAACPLWGMHRAEFVPDYSPAFTAWQAHNNKPMSHGEFADFVEVRLADFVTPDSATMLEVSTGFQATGKSSFSSAVRLQSGDVQLSYAQEVRGTVRQSELEVPSEFMIAVPVYEFHAPIHLNARLRYRVKDGDLRLWYEFDRLDDALAVYDTQLLADIRSKLRARVMLGKISSSLQPVTARDDG